MKNTIRPLLALLLNVYVAYVLLFGTTGLISDLRTIFSKKK